jgi:hypothetical protein
MKLKHSLALLALSAVVTTVCAETINTTDGNFTVIESLAPLGSPLKYSSGGDGLTGLAGSWPVAAPDGNGVDNYDHYWAQFDPAIVWTSRTALSSVFAIPGIDHGPNPQENLEFIIWGSNDGTTWEEGKISAIYRDGFDAADTPVGHSDDYTSLWSFSQGYTWFKATSGDHLSPSYGSTGEGEIDALAAPLAVPEPSTYGLMVAGLAVVGAVARRRGKRA